MNIRQAKSLKPGDRVHYTGFRECTRTVGPRGGVTIDITECRVMGQPKTWKRSPDRVSVPVKFGMYRHTHIIDEELQNWHLAEDCPLLEESTQENVDLLEPIIDDDSYID
jgi:hypothetical protein